MLPSTKRPGAVCVWIVLILASGPALAQTGGIEVQVLAASSGDPLPGATVTIANAIGLVATTAQQSDSAGLVRFPVLRSGRGYSVSVALAGYATYRLPDLTVRSENVTSLIVQLTPELREVVRASVREPLIDLDRSGTTSRFTDRFVDNLPVAGRTYQNVLTLAPGVKDPDGDGNPNVHGARSRDFQARVNGVSNVDPLTGQYLSQVNPESIEEIEVLTAGPGARFGRAQGGFAQILQKQGSNDFEGVLYTIYRSSELDGNGASRGEPPPFDWFQPGFQVSGALVRDRLWYRLSHEWEDREEPVNVLGDLQLRTRDGSLNDDQITWQASPRNKLTLQYRSDPLTIDGLELSSAVSPESSRKLERGGDTYVLGWMSPVSPRLFVDSGVSYQDSFLDLVPSQPGAIQDCLVFTRYLSLNAASCLDNRSNRFSGPFPESSRDRRQRLTVHGDATWFVTPAIGGSHRLRFGIEVANERYLRDLERRATIDFTRIINRFPPPPVYGEATVAVPVPRRDRARATGTNWSLYLEDQFRPIQRLAITLGVRLDRAEILSEGREPFDPADEARRYRELRAMAVSGALAASRTFTTYEDIQGFYDLLADALGVPATLIPSGSTAIQSSFWIHRRRFDDFRMAETTLSPRLSVAWDPRGNGKTRISFSAGRYRDKVFLAVPLVGLEPFSQSLEFLALPDFQTSEPLYAFRFFGGITPSITARTVDHDLTTPYQDEWTLGVEQALWPESSIRVSYVRRRFRDQLQDIDINHVANGEVLNPAWGEILEVGNHNTADYEGYILEFDRRFYRGWQMRASYTRSEAFGQAEDFDVLLGNNVNLLRDEAGYLSYDQRHVVRVNAIALTPWGLRVGGAVRWESGLPFSILRSGHIAFRNPEDYGNLGTLGFQSVFTYPTGQRNDQRNESRWTFDLKLVREFELPRATELQLTAEIFNLLNDDTVDEQDRINGATAGTRRFGRQFQLGLRLAF